MSRSTTKTFPSQGYPQSLLYILRAGGMTYDQIRGLPTPALDPGSGAITDDYFYIIRDHFGVNEEILPSRYQSPAVKTGNQLLNDPRRWTKDELFPERSI